MIEWWQKITVAHPKRIVIGALIILFALGVYGAGVFSALSSSGSDMNADSTEAAETQRVIERNFGDTPQGDIVLFERANDTLGSADSQPYQAEVARILANLEVDPQNIQSFTTTGSDMFISNDRTATYVVVQLDGSQQERYNTLRTFQSDVDSSTLDVSIGGSAAINEQTNATVSRELAHIELVSLPILLVLMLVFFRSVTAALVPLGIAIFTIVGAFALSRMLAQFITIDTYAVNVITILGIGLAIDYALLSVNRFREELPSGTKKAVQTVIATSGRTIAFSGITVIACLLALLVFPVEIMRSIAIGVASAVAMAVLATITVLPAALLLIGTRINRFSLPTRKKHSSSPKGFWHAAATVTTQRPVVTLALGLIIVGASVIPLTKFAPGAMDYNWLARDNESYHVTQKISEEFPKNPFVLTAVLDLGDSMSLREKTQRSCELTAAISRIDGVDEVRSAAPATESLDCAAILQLQAQDTLPAELQTAMNAYIAESAVQFSIASSHPVTSNQARNLIAELRSIEVVDGSWHIGGEMAAFHDNTQLYIRYAPLAVTIVILSMFVLLSLALQSVVVPIQAIIVNTIGLIISMAIVVGVFQLGWLTDVVAWPQVDGIALAAPILVIAIAFGLAMDYSVFLYARMREVYDATGDSTKAVKQGIVKTGPIITAAALALFVVVVGFTTSSVLFMQIIGLGLAIAVIVDAFFVRLLLVPSIMALMGKTSWWGPKFLAKYRIKHD